MIKDGKTKLVIDIGSGSIGSAVVLIGPKNTVKASTRYELEYGDRVDFGTLLEKMFLGIEHTLKQVQKQELDHISIYLHSPWHSVHTKNVTLKSEKSFSITESLIQDTTKNETELFLKNDKNKFPGYEKLTVIESTVPEIRINGYHVDDPFDKKSNNCDILISLALAPKDIVQEITKLCTKFTKISSRDISFHSATINFAHICSNLFSKNEGLMILDIGSELTDISLVKNRALNSGISFVGGTHDVVRKISEILKTSFSDSLSKAHAVFSGVSTIEILEHVNGNLIPLTTSWQRSIAESLSKIVGIERVPRKIIVICEDLVLAPWYTNAIESDTFTQYLHSAGKFQTITPSIDSLKDILLVEDVSYIDTSLALLCTLN